LNLESSALEAIRLRKPDAAVPLLKQIISVDPAWSHGAAHYNLAGCYEDVGEIENARVHYEEALRISPGNDLFMGGYASFLYLHGMPREALTAHLRLIEAYSINDLENEVAAVRPALVALAKKLDWSDVQLEQEVAAARARGRSAG
jgi:Tfp pilus assembly protein PilF